MVALEYIWTLDTVIFSFISRILRFFLIFIVVRKQQLQYHTIFNDSENKESNNATNISNFIKLNIDAIYYY